MAGNQNSQLIEKLAHKNRERIPERTVHAKGWGAHGTLTVTGDTSRLHQGQVHHYHKDGPMPFFQPRTGNVDAFYEPNSFGGATQDERFAEPPLAISGDADRFNHRDGNDDDSARWATCSA